MYAAKETEMFFLCQSSENINKKNCFLNTENNTGTPRFGGVPVLGNVDSTEVIY